MGRLTFKRRFEFFKPDEETTTISIKGYTQITEQEGTRGAKSFYLVGEAVEKLADYEDAEEQGLLLRLPCSIGEPIFVVPSLVNYKLNKLNHYEKNNRVYEQIVCNVVFIKNGYLLNTCDGFCNVRGSEYGKTWFLLKSEAEAALQAMEKECE